MKIFFILLFLMLNLFSKETHFKISYDANYAPFSYKEDGKEVGLLIDIWKLWAKNNNYTIEFVEGLLWENAINLAKENKVDYFLGTNSYEEWMQASNFFYETKTVYFNLKKDDYTLDLKENIKIGIIGNDYKEFVLKDFPNAVLTSYEDYPEALNALKNGEIKLFFDEKLAVEYYIVKNNLFHLIKSLDNLVSKKKVQAISSNKELIDIFNKGFVNIPVSELLQLEKKWILNDNEQYYKSFKLQIDLTKEELEFIKNHKIKVSISNSWEPFAFKSTTNEAVGISSEYWDIIQNKLNLNTENKFFETFNEQLNSIKNNESDVIYSAGETPQRKEYAIFSKEYVKFPISIVTKKDENFIESISLIKDKKIAIGNNFTAHNILKNYFPEIDFLLVNSIKEGLDAVSNNKAYAFVDIQPVLFYNIAKLGFTDLKVTGNTGLSFSLKFMINDDYPILQSILNKAITSISVNELETIINKWNNVQFQTNVDYDLLWKVLTVILVIVLAFIYRNYTLKNLNKTLKEKVEEKTKQLNEMNKNLEELVKTKTDELIQKETILSHQSKMAAMGEMIENIAHQWRQPLSVISTAATGAKLKKDLNLLNDEDFYETMDIINKSSQHLSSTIDDFRYFFSKNKELKNFNLSAPIKKILYLLGTKLKTKEIKIIENYQSINVLNLENEFLQVVLNIINNSIDAFEGKEHDTKLIFIDIYKENDFAILKIKDNAGGIKEDIINRIFEPYFTTKHKSQGTGIGLYMVLEIVKKHMNGEISVKNQEYIFNDKKYKGAEFTISLALKQ